VAPTTKRHSMQQQLAARTQTTDPVDKLKRLRSMASAKVCAHCLQNVVQIHIGATVTCALVHMPVHKH
jgi:hypothetical protein